MDTDLNKFFGNQMDLFPETLAVTREEEEAFSSLSRQVGGNHYRRAIQPWDIISEWELNFWEGNIQKYLLRHRFKNRKEDLEKARHYLDYLIENYDALY